MADLLPLFSLEVVHPYFDAPQRLELRFEPDAAAKAWLRRTGAIVRASANWLRVYYPSSLTRIGPPAAPFTEDVELAFGVRAVDAGFAAYTEGLAAAGDQPLTFCSEDARQNGDGVWILQPALWRSSPWSGSPRPNFVVDVSISSDLREAGRAYRLTLRSRATIWKYLLVGRFAAAQPCIVDPRNALRFEAGPNEQLADGRLAATLCSSSPIPLAERFPHRLELRAGDENGAMLMKPLPVPCAADLSSAGGGPALVSQIFVPS